MFLLKEWYSPLFILSKSTTMNPMFLFLKQLQFGKDYVITGPHCEETDMCTDGQEGFGRANTRAGFVGAVAYSHTWIMAAYSLKPRRITIITGSYWIEHCVCRDYKHNIVDDQ